MSNDKRLPRCLWGVAANVIDENVYGENKVVRHGTKYFRANQRVYCFPANWSDGGERLYVVGRRRGNHGLICVIMPVEQLENFRVKKIYSPLAIRKILELDSLGNRHPDCWYLKSADRREAEDFAAFLSMRERQTKKARALLPAPAPHQL